jgi:hypothetical protein
MVNTKNMKFKEITNYWEQYVDSINNVEENIRPKKMVELLGDDNLLVLCYLDMMKSLHLEGIPTIGAVHPYIHNVTNWKGPATYILRDTQWKGGMISETFLTSITYLASDNMCEGISMLEPWLTNQNVAISHFDLLDYWFQDKLLDFSGINYTYSKWTEADIKKIDEFIRLCTEHRNSIKEDKIKVLEELNRLGIAKDIYIKTDKVSPILKELNKIHGLDCRYFPGYIAENPDYYFKYNST